MSNSTTASQNPPLILASTSVYRRELLERLRIPFEVISPQVDETPLTGESSPELALRLANAKAAAVAKVHPHAWVIGSDQVADLCGAAIGKPGNFERAMAQLQLMRGQTVTFRKLSLCRTCYRTCYGTYRDTCSGTCSGTCGGTCGIYGTSTRPPA